MNPFVSVVTITHGRVSNLENALKSFLDQEYDGRKEMVIFNDFESQNLKFEHPEVRVINRTEAAATIGDLRNMAVAHSSGDFIINLDDDDTMLSGCLEAMVRERGDGEYANLFGYLKWDGSELTMVNKSITFSGYTRSAFYELGGYRSINSGQDSEFLTRLVREKEGFIFHPEEPIFIYDWSREGIHLSKIGRDTDGKNGRELFKNWISSQELAGRIPSGDVELHPSYAHDWRKLVNQIAVEA